MLLLFLLALAICWGRMKTKANASKETCSSSKHTVWWFVNSLRSHWIPTNADTGRKYECDLPAGRISIFKSSIYRAMDVSCANGEVHIHHRVRSALVAAARVRRIKMKVRTFSWKRHCVLGAIGLAFWGAR